MSKQSIQDFLDQHDDAAIARIVGRTPRAVASWRRGERRPRPADAMKLVEAFPKQLSLESIYRGQAA